MPILGRISISRRCASSSSASRKGVRLTPSCSHSSGSLSFSPGSRRVLTMLSISTRRTKFLADSCSLRSEMVIMEMLLLSVCGLLRAYLKTKKMASIPQSQAGSRAFSHKILLWLQKQAGFSTFQLHARGAACSQYSTNRFGLSRFLQKMQQKAKHTGRDFCCRSRSWTF